MGKPSSYLFGRMHDMKAVFFDENGEFQFVILSMSLPNVFLEFTQKHPNFSKNDAVLALCSMICLDNDTRFTQYRSYADKYGGDVGVIIEEILKQSDELDRLLSDNPTDTSIIYLMSFCLGVNGRNVPEAMAGAHGLMNRVLDMEENGQIDVDKELTTWATLANFLNFEEAHDRSFGNPIVGNSPFYNKDKNGNPVKKDTSSSTSTQSYNNTASSKSGGCYVATAVYGSYDCPEVWTLRRYRDYDLAEHWYGRAFIRVYYAISPTIVRWFGSSTWFNRMWRKKLDTIVEGLQHNGYSSAPYIDKDWK